MSPMRHDESLTGDPLTDALVPLVTELADAVFEGDAAEIDGIRQRAEAWVCSFGGQPGDAGWAMAIVAAAMLPGGVHPRLLLAWRAGSPAEASPPAAQELVPVPRARSRAH